MPARRSRPPRRASSPRCGPTTSRRRWSARSSSAPASTPPTSRTCILGCAFPEGEQGFNVARLVGFLADLPLSVAGATVNRFCGSSMQAIHIAAGAIQMNAGEVFICAGVEIDDPRADDGLQPDAQSRRSSQRYPQAFVAMGETAENLARKYEIPRRRQEEFARRARSRRRRRRRRPAASTTRSCRSSGRAARSTQRRLHPRPDTTLEALAELKLAFDEKGTVTAGTSSPLTDGASAVLVCSEEYAAAQGPRRRWRASRASPSPAARRRSWASARSPSTQQGARRAPASSSPTSTSSSSTRPSPSQSLACCDELGLDLGEGQPRRRRHRARPSAGRHRRAHHRQGGVAAAARGQALRARHAVHRRRSGHRHRCSRRCDHGRRLSRSRRSASSAPA